MRGTNLCGGQTPKKLAGEQLKVKTTNNIKPTNKQNTDTKKATIDLQKIQSKKTKFVSVVDFCSHTPLFQNQK